MGLKEWIFQKYATKLIKQGIQIGVSWVVGHNLDQYGVKIDPITLSAGIWTGLETLRSVAKHKFGLTWL